MWADGLSRRPHNTPMESLSYIDHDLKMQLMISSYCEAESLYRCHLLKLLCWLQLSVAPLGHTVLPRAWLIAGCISNSSSSRPAGGGEKDEVGLEMLAFELVLQGKGSSVLGG